MQNRFALRWIETTEIHELSPVPRRTHAPQGVASPDRRLYNSARALADAETRYRALLDDIRREFPRFRMVRKHESGWQRAIHVGLVAITAGRMRAYLTRYQTTIGNTVYVTPDWDERSASERYVTMRHERVHLQQFARWSLPVMAVLYTIVPLPFGLAWCRARFEQAAYAETIRAAAEVHGTAHVEAQWFRDAIVDQFCGPSYGWMWPFRRSLERWYDRVLAELDPDAVRGT